MKITDTRTLARADIALTALGLGCAQMGHLLKHTPFADAQATAEAAWDLGIRYFDTAPFYGFTRSERRLGALMDDRPRAEFRLSTKVGRLMVPEPAPRAEDAGFVDPSPFVQLYDYSYDAILRAFEASRQRLGLARIDILYVHDIETGVHGEAHGRHWAALTKGGGFRALSELREAGAIGAFGLGVNDAQAVRDALEECDLDVSMLAGRYTLLEQESLDLLAACHARGAGIVAAGVFNSGILAGNGNFNYGTAPEAMIRRTEGLRGVAAEFGIPLQAAALQFPLAHPAVVSVVVGARNAAQIRANAAWFETQIPPDFWTALTERGLLAEGVPHPGAG
ncbi:oxidoreductase [Aureimonas endophytica]|uniref:Oxidoreductase n=1 Tax=Aureimonas endophytica TaxID=2027858 RepID=A0A916ZS29_9HYPH|nr:aldo/keto reductase [Aureimonas endophytica]GGE11385.1 oxidoreductase [Aureimonas endophytica]